MWNIFSGAKKASTPVVRPIIMCSTMRSGSTMICEDMRNTRSLGTAKELFKDWRPGKKDHPQRLQRLKKREATENGVFSAKVMSKYVPFLDECLRAGRDPVETDKAFPEFAKVFEDAVWVYLKREDIVAQAISRYVSSATGVYHNFEDGRHTKSEAVLKVKGAKDYNTDVKYNFGIINRSVHNIAREQAIWDHFFKSNNITPMRITYEECVKDTTFQYLKDMAELAGVTLETPPPRKRTIKKLSNARNEQFHQRYLADTILKIKQKSFGQPTPPERI